MAEPKVAGTKKKMRFSLPLWQRNVRYGEVDLAFFLIVIALLVMGIVMMFSASYAWAIAEGRDGTYYAVSQIKNAVVGLVIMCVLCLIDYHFLQKKFIAVCAYVLPILLLIMVFVPGIGVTDGGATRWIAIGSFNFQPSEIMKIGIVIFFSYVIEKNYANMRSFRKGLLPLLFAAMALGSIAAGALWGFIPAWFKSRWNTNETLFTLMMNYVATSIVACMTNIMRGQASSLGTLNKATKAGWFPVIMGQRYTINIIVVIVLTFVMYAYLRFSKQGYEISVVGESENTARYAGINVRRVTVRTMLISGAICGLCGFLIVAGKDQTISTASANGRGFTAIIVAWLAKFNTFYMALISFLLVFLERGASEIASAYSLNEYAADIITGIILFFILGSEFFINYRVIPRGAHKEGK